MSGIRDSFTSSEENDTRNAKQEKVCRVFILLQLQGAASNISEVKAEGQAKLV